VLYEPTGIGHEAEILKRLNKIRALKEKGRHNKVTLEESKEGEGNE